ncbi:uncharacterized protein C8A04DRAFT_29687 [Dichotomopilus funicola]|uniref:Uncharacterized protein n=1 Tax=Dichotomopilus funicola TaxID=1934379 RepID=A0AAN6V1I7_9PEZI|nr:hypothetical protein C8A04DRAFT_29687 [Dichotomopilus funicola]
MCMLVVEPTTDITTNTTTKPPPQHPYPITRGLCARTRTLAELDALYPSVVPNAGDEGADDAGSACPRPPPAAVTVPLRRHEGREGAGVGGMLEMGILEMGCQVRWVVVVMAVAVMVAAEAAVIAVVDC